MGSPIRDSDRDDNIRLCVTYDSATTSTTTGGSVWNVILYLVTDRSHPNLVSTVSDTNRNCIRSLEEDVSLRAVSGPVSTGHVMVFAFPIRASLFERDNGFNIV